MSLWNFFFGGLEEKEQGWRDAWKRVHDMPVLQLCDIVDAKPNTPYGILACALLSQKAPTELLERLRKSSGLLSLLKNWKQNEVLLLGKGNEFDDIRQLFREMQSTLEEVSASY